MIKTKPNFGDENQESNIPNGFEDVIFNHYSIFLFSNETDFLIQQNNNWFEC